MSHRRVPTLDGCSSYCRTETSDASSAVSSPWSIAITADGAFFTWGQGEYGCLGHGEDLSDQLLPKKIEMWAPGQ